MLYIALVIPFASAVTISFSPVGLSPDDLHFYNSSGTLIGIYNTSSTAITLNNNESYSILVVPASTNLLGNHPDTWFQMFVTKLRENATSIVLVLFLIGILIAALRRG